MGLKKNKVTFILLLLTQVSKHITYINDIFLDP